MQRSYNLFATTLSLPPYMHQAHHDLNARGFNFRHFQVRLGKVPTSGDQSWATYASEDVSWIATPPTLDRVANGEGY